MRPRVVIGAGVILGAFIVIAVLAFFANQQPYMSVDELLADASGYTVAAAASGPGPAEDAAGQGQLDSAPGPALSAGRRLQVRGTIDHATVERPAQGLALRFDLRGAGGRLPVSYTGFVPDTFDQADTATVVGRVGADGRFEADELLVQCPSKYEAATPGAEDRAQ